MEQSTTPKRPLTKWFVISNTDGQLPQEELTASKYWIQNNIMRFIKDSKLAIGEDSTPKPWLDCFKLRISLLQGMMESANIIQGIPLETLARINKRLQALKLKLEEIEKTDDKNPIDAIKNELIAALLAVID